MSHQQIVGVESTNVKCRELNSKVQMTQETVLIVMKYFGQASQVDDEESRELSLACV